MSLGDWFREQKMKYGGSLGGGGGGLRSGVNQKSALVGLVAVLILVGSLFAIMWQLGGSRRGGNAPRNVFFMDVSNGELFPAPVNSIPPIDAPSGPGNGVKAYVYTCGSCSKSEWFIAYVQKYTPEAREKLIELNRRMEQAASDPESAYMFEDQADIENEMLIAKADAQQWISGNSEQGAELIRSEIINKCPEGKRPKPCYPD